MGDLVGCTSSRTRWLSCRQAVVRRPGDAQGHLALALARAAPTQAGHDDEHPRLSPREREVAILVTPGLENRHIAEQLVVSERTAETTSSEC